MNAYISVEVKKEDDDPEYIPDRMSDSDDTSPVHSPERKKRASAVAAVKTIKKAARNIMNPHKSSPPLILSKSKSPSQLPQGLVAVPQKVAKLPQGYVAVPQSGKKSGQNASLLATALQSSGITPARSSSGASQIKTTVAKPKDFLATIQVGSLFGLIHY